MNQGVSAGAALLSEDAAARYLCVSRSFLRRSRMDGDLPNRTPGPPYIRLGGGRAIRYAVADLDAWIGQHRAHPAPFPQNN